MAGVMTVHMCSAMAVADHTEAKMAAFLPEKDRRVQFHIKYLQSGLQKGGDLVDQTYQTFPQASYTEECFCSCHNSIKSLSEETFLEDHADQVLLGCRVRRAALYPECFSHVY